MQILVIDDERPTLAMFELLLEAMGYQPVAAESGEKGLDAFEKGDFPIVITDIKMPGIDGMEVLSRIKARKPATEVIVITGHAGLQYVIPKAVASLTKPFDQAELLRIVRETIGQ